ncbi:hypothetical protein LINPERPRIM_LOCUS7934 [Linum perenne]
MLQRSQEPTCLTPAGQELAAHVPGSWFQAQ